MAKILTEAYQAKDGTIFTSEYECNQYETNLLFQKAPMYKFVKDNDNDILYITPATTIDDVDLIFIVDENIKNLFFELRKEKYINDYNALAELEETEKITDVDADDLNQDKKYSINCNGEWNNHYGLFALQYNDTNLSGYTEKTYTWVPAEEYTAFLDNIIELIEEAKTRAQLLYTSRN